MKFIMQSSHWRLLQNPTRLELGSEVFFHGIYPELKTKYLVTRWGLREPLYFGEDKATAEGVELEHRSWWRRTVLKKLTVPHLNEGTFKVLAGKFDEGKPIIVTQGEDDSDDCLLFLSISGHLGSRYDLDKSHVLDRFWIDGENWLEVVALLKPGEEVNLTIIPNGIYSYRWDGQKLDRTFKSFAEQRMERALAVYQAG